MTVKELIAELKRFPEDLEVQIYDEDAGEYRPLGEIESFEDDGFIGLRPD